MTSTTSLFYDAISGENRNNLKYQKKTALLKQQENLQDYKEKMASYRAKNSATGVFGISGGVQKGLAEETNNENIKISNDLNEKIKQEKYKKRKKSLISLGLKLNTSS